MRKEEGLKASIAADLIESDNRIELVLAELLKDTIICQDYSTAVKL